MPRAGKSGRERLHPSGASSASGSPSAATARPCVPSPVPYSREQVPMSGQNPSRFWMAYLETVSASNECFSFWPCPLKRVMNVFSASEAGVCLRLSALWNGLAADSSLLSLQRLWGLLPRHPGNTETSRRPASLGPGGRPSGHCRGSWVSGEHHALESQVLGHLGTR